METKELMRKRDKARKAANKMESNEKVIWLNKYRKLRNQVNCKVRQESRDFNNNVYSAKKNIKIYTVSLPI